MLRYVFVSPNTCRDRSSAVGGKTVANSSSAAAVQVRGGGVRDVVKGWLGVAACPNEHNAASYLAIVRRSQGGLVPR